VLHCISTSSDRLARLCSHVSVNAKKVVNKQRVLFCECYQTAWKCVSVGLYRNAGNNI